MSDSLENELRRDFPEETERLDASTRELLKRMRNPEDYVKPANLQVDRYICIICRRRVLIFETARFTGWHCRHCGCFWSQDFIDARLEKFTKPITLEERPNEYGVPSADV